MPAWLSPAVAALQHLVPVPASATGVGRVSNPAPRPAPSAPFGPGRGADPDGRSDGEPSRGGPRPTDLHRPRPPPARM